MITGKFNDFTRGSCSHECTPSFTAHSGNPELARRAVDRPPLKTKDTMYSKALRLSRYLSSGRGSFELEDRFSKELEEITGDYPPDPVDL